MKVLISIGLAAGLAVSLATAASADVVLTYTGQDFTTVSGSYTTSDKITGTIDLTSPLGDNLSLAQISPTSFSFNDGVQTFTQANSFDIEELLFSTNSSGVITAWSVLLVTGSNQMEITGGLGPANGDIGFDGGPNQGLNSVEGSWSVRTTSSTVPEPLTLSLFGVGLVGAAAMRRRKAQKLA